MKELESFRNELARKGYISTFLEKYGKLSVTYPNAPEFLEIYRVTLVNGTFYVLFDKN